MARFCNTTLQQSNLFDNIKSGLLFHGTFTNNTNFTGPGLLQFECPDRCHQFTTNEIAEITVLSALCFILMLLGLCQGEYQGQIKMARKLTECKNEQERMDYVYSKLRSKQESLEPLTHWPGEQDDNEKEHVGDSEAIPEEIQV